MGSCCSSNAKSDLTQKLDPHSSMAARRAPRSDDDHKPYLESRAPPPTLEEETVKEVLSVSETPKPRPKLPKQEEEEEEEKKRSSDSPKPVFPVFELDVEERRASKVPAEEILEVSEICSLSESVSTTTNVTRDDNENDCDEGEIGHARAYRSPVKLPNNRSFSGDMGGGRRDKLVAGRSPSRRSEQSPGRKIGNGPGSVRIVQSKDPGRVMPRRGLNLAPEDTRRRRQDPGEGSARRSRSPAMSRAGSAVGRSPSARGPARSPARANGAPNEKVSRRVSEDPKWPAKSNNTNDELLDNPLVSFECFIFL